MAKMSLKLVTVLLLGLALTACKSQEERAEEYYQSGLELLEAGDSQRAFVEFQNVFKFNPNHRGARESLAHNYLENGDFPRAYGQFLNLAEQFPEDLEVRIVLSKLAFQNRNWSEFNRHGEAAVSLGPDNPEVGVIALGLEYQKAVVENEATVVEGAAIRAEERLVEFPDSRILRNILMDFNVRKSNIDAAIGNLDHLLNLFEDEKELHDQRLALVARTQNADRIEQQLLSMIEKFPDDQSLKSNLLRLYITDQKTDKAEEFLRSISDPSDEDPAAFLDLIRFIAEVKGEDAARIEIERGIAENPDPTPFRALRAGLNFGQGDRDAAIQEMEEILAAAEFPDEVSGVKVALARMLLADGNEVGAQRLVEEVLTENTPNTDALKLKAGWQIAADDTDGAIVNLRSAIDLAPDDTQAVEMLALAYERAGSPDLAREYLAIAVESSGNAPTQSIRYATALMMEERYLPAEDVLIPALRLAPGNTQLLTVLGRLYLAMDDQPRATQVIDTLKRMDTGETRQLANVLRAEQLQAEGGVSEAVAFLETVASESAGDLSAQMLLLRGRLANGDAEGANELIGSMIADNPQNSQLPFAMAAVKSATGDLQGAAADYKELLEENPDRPRVWLEYSRVLLRMGDSDAADKAIENGLAANQDNPNLLWARASVLEQDNRIDEAIAIYEDLYARASNSIIVANNLASLLSARRDDEESLERAFIVARRFKDTETPALQDTYGWILHRKGNSIEALPYLENAAIELDRDALTQFHLAMVYIALEQKENAVAQLQKTLDVAGPADTRPQIEQARSELARLQNATDQP